MTDANARVPLTVKIGGIAGQHAGTLSLLADRAPADTVVVHGGGTEVAEWSRRLGLEPRTHDGLRVTDTETLEVAVGVLGGLVNTRLVAAFSAAGRPAVGLTGADGSIIRVRRRDPALGEVGEIFEVDTTLLETLTDAGLTPVVASIGADAAGALLNINADEVAGAVAAARGGLLLLCTDVEGVLRDDALLDDLDAATAEQMLEDGSASAGMRPKLRAALVAARAGCEVHIIDGRSPDVMERALRGEPAGTKVTAA